MSIDSKTLEKIFLEMMGKKSQKVFVLHITHGEYKKLLQTLILPPYAKKHIKQGMFYTYISYTSQFPSVNPSTL